LLSTLHGSAAKPVSFLVSCLDLPPDLKSQLDCGGSHLLSNERANSSVNGRSINRLARGLAVLGVSSVTNIPDIEAATPGGISSTEMPTASSTDGAPLQ
jgi:hypothetical protein